MNIEELEKKIYENTDKIMLNLKRIENNKGQIENNCKNIEKNSYALEFIKDYKHENRRLFIILIIILIMWFATIGYLIYIINDIGIDEEKTIEIDDVSTIDNSHIKIGDDIWEKSE